MHILALINNNFRFTTCLQNIVQILSLFLKNSSIFSSNNFWIFGPKYSNIWIIFGFWKCPRIEYKYLFQHWPGWYNFTLDDITFYLQRWWGGVLHTSRGGEWKPNWWLHYQTIPRLLYIHRTWQGKYSFIFRCKSISVIGSVSHMIENLQRENTSVKWLFYF